MDQHVIHSNAPERPASRLMYDKMGASPKALGVACAFFGILLSVGAIAGMSSGRVNLHEFAPVVRAASSLGAGIASFWIGTVCLHRARCRRH